MSINHAILGMLSCKPLTGYDLKKIMQKSSFMYWSGNSNQIYKALIELNNEGYVTNETQHQDGSPSKKIYTITNDGLIELKRWSLTLPETPETKKSFLIQLAWTWQSNNLELNKLLDQYEQEVKGRLLTEQRKSDGEIFSPNRTSRENVIWDLIYENVVDVYEQELSWINRVRKTIEQYDDLDYPIADKLTQNYSKEEETMNFEIIDKNTRRYVLLGTNGNKIRTEQDALELISICAKNETSLLLITGERLSDDFFRLGTGLAGAVMQKFTMYGIRVAIVLEQGHAKGKFKDYLTESNRGKTFNAYPSIADAESWLLKTKDRMEVR